MATFTFEDLDRSADRTLGHALLGRVAANAIEGFYQSWRVSKALSFLVQALDYDLLSRLSREQSEMLVVKLQKLHHLLVDLSRSHEIESISKVAILGKYISDIRENTEDLGDIIEDLVMSSDGDFQSLLRDCAAEILAK